MTKVIINPGAGILWENKNKKLSYRIKIKKFGEGPFSHYKYRACLYRMPFEEEELLIIEKTKYPTVFFIEEILSDEDENKSTSIGAVEDGFVDNVYKIEKVINQKGQLGYYIVYISTTKI